MSAKMADLETRMRLTCFKAYDIRAKLGADLNEDIAYRIGRSVAETLKAAQVVIGFDARETSPMLAQAAARGVRAAGADGLDIGLAGTEEMYWAVTSQKACAGIEVTASHNPIDYNGMKIVKHGSEPLTEGEFHAIQERAEAGRFSATPSEGRVLPRAQEARRAYVEKLMSFVSPQDLKPLKIVINAGNGAAGPSFDALVDALSGSGASADFIRVHHAPDAAFPNGIPNPLLPENHFKTADVVRREGADFGVAFDGDFDRCFLFDGEGDFVPGEYVIGLLAEAYLAKEPGAKIVHDPRVMWNTIESVTKAGGEPIISKTGHAFIKQRMRDVNALYGGEMSAHHYFRDFAYCDSGMIPWLLIWELLSTSQKSLRTLLEDARARFPSSGEMNFTVSDADACLTRAEEVYGATALSVDRLDGVSIAHEEWRMNLRKSNTEPLVRLNVETRGAPDLLRKKTDELTQLIKGKCA
jgi:phosphomannomutase